MRRFASVFISKRDKSDQENANHILITTPARSPSSTFSTPPLSTASDPPHSSASSSGSTTASIQTPDDDAHLIFPSTTMKSSWKSWIGGKRSSSLKHLDSKGKERNRDLPQWKPSVTPSLQLPPLGNRAAKRIVAADEDFMLPASDSTSFPDQLPVPHRTPPSPALARKNLAILTKNSLVPPQPVSPFVQHSLGPIYPRSSNQSRLLPRRPPMFVVMLKKRLLTRLEDPSFIFPLSEESSLLHFGSHSTPSEISAQRTFPFDTPHPEKMTRIFRSSPGLRRWISRPCFEDRFVVFVAEDSDVKCRAVSGSSLAIAALEYSEYLDVLADPDFDQEPRQGTNVDEPWSLLAEPPPSASDPPLLSAPIHSRNSFITVPSPLRNEHNPPVVTKESIASEQTVPPTRNNPSISASTVKRVVRFVEDDSDDGIPLHLVRLKKKREEKAKFLRREQLKRAREEEEERRRLEEEAMERDRLRLAKEREKKDREQRLYAEEVAATRMRRDFQRAGGLSSQSNSSSSLLVPSPSSPSIKDSERNRPRDSRRYSSKSIHDPHPRREDSDPGFTTSKNHNIYDSSSGSSQPGHSPASLSGHGRRSRPPSTYSANTQSSSDEARHSGGSRRNSVAAAPGNSSRAYQTWSGSSQSLHHIPPVPQVPEYLNDMPLLPPAAPFMKHRYPRQNHQSVSPAPDSSKSRRGTSISSTRRATELPRRQSTSSTRPDHPSLASSPPHRSDVRTPQSKTLRGESRQPNSLSSYHNPGRPQPTPSLTYPQLPHGLPSQYVQLPSPWTALPSQTGQLPTVMPVSPFTHVGFQGIPQGRGDGTVDAHDWRHTLIS